MTREDGFVTDAVEGALSTGEPLTMLEARTIAGRWHSGQWSALYSLSSAGAIRWADLESEVDEIEGDEGLAMQAWWENLEPEPEPELWLCADCAIVAANGPNSLPPDIGAGREAEILSKCEGPVALGDSERDHRSFSWSRCDGCGSTLGGDRFGAFTIEVSA